MLIGVHLMLETYLLIVFLWIVSDMDLVPHLMTSKSMLHMHPLRTHSCVLTGTYWKLKNFIEIKSCLYVVQMAIPPNRKSVHEIRYLWIKITSDANYYWLFRVKQIKSAFYAISKVIILVLFHKSTVCCDHFKLTGRINFLEQFRMIFLYISSNMCMNRKETMT